MRNPKQEVKAALDGAAAVRARLSVIAATVAAQTDKAARAYAKALAAAEEPFAAEREALLAEYAALEKKILQAMQAADMLTLVSDAGHVATVSYAATRVVPPGALLAAAGPARRDEALACLKVELGKAEKTFGAALLKPITQVEIGKATLAIRFADAPEVEAPNE